MSRWAYGIYDSDSASDWAVETCKKHLSQAEAIVNLPDLGICDFDLILPPLDVVCYLCKHADAVPFDNPDILNWRQKLIVVYEKEVVELNWPKEEIAKRRKMIDDLFDRLEKTVKDSSAPERWDPEPGSVWDRIKQLEKQHKDVEIDEETFSVSEILNRQGKIKWDDRKSSDIPKKKWWQFWKKTG